MLNSVQGCRKIYGLSRESLSGNNQLSDKALVGRLDDEPKTLIHERIETGLRMGHERRGSVYRLQVVQSAYGRWEKVCEPRVAGTLLVAH